MISVLTVNYDSSADLAELIASIREHRGGAEVELIITNNSASDEIAVSGDASIPIRILTPDSNIGFAAGVNLAYRSSRGDILMIANPDVRVSGGTFDAALRFMDASSDVGVVLPLLRSLDGSVQASVRQFYTWAVALYARSPLRLLSQPSFFRRYLCGDVDRTRPTDVDWGLAAAMFLRRSDWPDRELFDERFFLYFGGRRTRQVTSSTDSITIVDGSAQRLSGSYVNASTPLVRSFVSSSLACFASSEA